MSLHKVCKVDDIKEESMILVCVDKREVIIAKHKGKIISFDPFCPHRYAYLHRGWFNDNNIVCPLHKFEFDLDTGKLVKIPDEYKEQREAWKASGDLKFYYCVIKDGCVYIKI
ncbi:MAG: hypothetical protein KatS3mg003_1792 [Candidatus Nitrosocaldaceae archaeon]|nr:MAG: hypothetical protein KatS3mg003_1792 [Candidatus Nitrosocaldaceae archaeon]